MKVKEYTTIIQSLEHNLDFATDAEVNRMILTKFNTYEVLFTYDEDNRASYQAVIDEWAPYANELYKTTQYEYDPIENYNRVETYQGSDVTTYGKKEANETSIKDAVETDLKTEHNVDSKSAANAGMKTEHGRYETRTPNLTDQTIHQESGYDNANPGTESSRDTTTRTGSETTSAPGIQNYDETTGDETDNYTHNTADAQDNYERSVGSKNSNYRETTGDPAHNYSQLSGSDTLAKGYTLTARGNIGTMSTQQMIEMERKIIVNVLAFYVEKFSKCFQIKIDGLYD